MEQNKNTYLPAITTFFEHGNLHSFLFSLTFYYYCCCYYYYYYYYYWWTWFYYDQYIYAFGRWFLPRRRYILSVNQFMHSLAIKLMILLYCCRNLKCYQVPLLFNFTHSKERAGAISGLKCLTLRGALVRTHLTNSHLI